MTTYQNNLEAFLQRYPQYREDFAAFEREGDSKRIFIQEKQIADITFFELYEDTQVIDSSHPRFWEGFNLDHQRTPHRQKNIGMIFGFGLGTLVELARSHLPCKTWIIAEPSLARFAAALRARDFRQIIQNPDIHFCFGKNIGDFFSPFFQILSARNLLLQAHSTHWIRHPVLDALYPQFAATLETQWNAAATAAKNMQSTADDGFEGFKNTLGNRKWIEESAGLSSLAGLFSNRVGLVVSTGPSLTNSLPALKALQDRVILLAADASLKILLENEIIPHFVFCLERDEGSKPFFQSLDNTKCRSLLVSFPLVPRNVIGTYEGPSLCVYRNYGYSLYLERECPRGIIQCGPSVAHMALVVGSLLGLKEIALVGQDLSYDPDSLASHPQGIAYEGWEQGTSLENLKRKLESQNDTLLMVPGNLRPHVPTCGTYEIFRQVFAQHVKGLSCSVVNVTRGGAKIPGIPWKSLDELQSEWITSQPVIDAAFTKIQTACDHSKQNQILLLQDLERDLTRWKLEIEKSLSHGADELQLSKNTFETDEKFTTLLFHFFGRDRIQIEWDLSETQEPLPHLRVWHQRILEIIQRLLSELTRFREKTAL